MVLKKETLEGGYANVESVVVVGNSDTSIDYRLHEVNARWRVSDMVIEHVILMSNFRAQFEREISRTSVQGMIEKFKQRQS
ncbi:MAG: ABC transporter substrate-binding protein [Candidatus Binatia bacterium]